MFRNISGASPCWWGLLGSNGDGIASATGNAPGIGCGRGSNTPFVGFFPLPVTARSPAVVIPNGEAMNSVARGENNDGVLRTSCIARSIFGEFVRSPSLGVLEGLGGDGAGGISKRSRKGRGLGETL